MLNEDKALALLSAAAAFVASQPDFAKFSPFVLALAGICKALWPSPKEDGPHGHP